MTLKPEVEVAQELLTTHEFIKRVTSCGHEANVERLHSVLTQRPNLTTFQRAKQLALHTEGCLADLVEEDSAPIRRSKQASTPTAGSRECAFGVTEKLRGRESFIQGAEIYDPKWGLGSIRLGVQELSEVGFPGSCLPFEQHWETGPR